jgi:heme-degrading monooxygenase HmoA
MIYHDCSADWPLRETNTYLMRKETAMTHSDGGSSRVPADEEVTLINLFEVPADQVDEFIAGWHERAEFMRTQPGFQEYRFYRTLSADSRFQLINIARWDSQQALRAATATPQFQAELQALNNNPDLNVTPHPGLYRVVLEAQAATAAQHL